MSLTYFPFDSGAGANITEDQWRKMARHWRTTGVLANEDNEFAVTESAVPAMSVDVDTGKAWIRGHYVESDASATKTLSASDPTNDRIDRIVLRVDFGANTITIEVLEGTPAASPVAPTLTQSSSTWEIALAQVLVNSAAASIVNADITDERTMSRTSVPLVTALPDNPSDGDEVDYLAAGTAGVPTAVWRLRYSADVTDAYPWICVGGTPILDVSDGAVSGGTAGNASGLSITPALAGLYRVRAGFLVTDGGWVASLRVNGSEVLAWTLTNNATGAYTGFERERELTVGAGQVVDLVSGNNGGNAASAQQFQMALIPFRVG